MSSPNANERLQFAIARACLGKEAEFERDLAGFLEAHGVAPEDAEVLLASPRRLGLYRRLVRLNVTGVVTTMLARTRARLEARAPDEFEKTMTAFLDEVGPRTPHLRDIPSEFLRFAAPRWRSAGNVAPWLVDYAELELVDFTISVAPKFQPPSRLAEVTVDRPLVFAEPKRLVRLGWAVHELSDSDLSQEPRSRSIALLVYRDADHRSRFLELTPLAAAILERLFDGSALGAAMVSACEAESHPLDDSVLGSTARWLAELAERGVLLGARDT